jgi:hypothetical protein
LIGRSEAAAAFASRDMVLILTGTPRMSVGRPADIRVLEEQPEFVCNAVPEALRMNHHR